MTDRIERVDFRLGAGSSVALCEESLAGVAGRATISKAFNEDSTRCSEFESSNERVFSGGLRELHLKSNVSA